MLWDSISFSRFTSNLHGCEISIWPGSSSEWILNSILCLFMQHLLYLSYAPCRDYLFMTMCNCNVKKKLSFIKQQKKRELNGEIRKLTRNTLGHKTGESCTNILSIWFLQHQWHLRKLRICHEHWKNTSILAHWDGSNNQMRWKFTRTEFHPKFAAVDSEQTSLQDLW